MAAISFLPPFFFLSPLSFFFLFFSSCFYSSKEGLALIRLITPLRHVCLSLLLSEVEGVLLSFLSECASGYVNLPCSGTQSLSSGLGFDVLRQLSQPYV